MSLPIVLSELNAALPSVTVTIDITISRPPDTKPAGVYRPFCELMSRAKQALHDLDMRCKQHGHAGIGNVNIHEMRRLSAGGGADIQNVQICSTVCGDSVSNRAVLKTWCANAIWLAGRLMAQYGEDYVHVRFNEGFSGHFVTVSTAKPT